MHDCDEKIINFFTDFREPKSTYNVIENSENKFETILPSIQINKLNRIQSKQDDYNDSAK